MRHLSLYCNGKLVERSMAFLSPRAKTGGLWPWNSGNLA